MKQKMKHVAKNGKSLKFKKNTKFHAKRPKKSQSSDSDASDVDVDAINEVPADIAASVNKLAREYVDKPEGVDENDLYKLLECDPLLASSGANSTGFLMEYKPVDTSGLWAQLNAKADAQEKRSEAELKTKRLFTDVGVYMAKYTSGGLPKPLKMLPKMKDWFELLHYTSPQHWTPNAVYEATRLFVSNLDKEGVELYLRNILLPYVRENIAKNRKLNVHLYKALKKGMFKIVPWFTSILIPLVREGCFYREAAIIGSVLLKTSIPVEYASAFIIEICQCTKWFGSTSFILLIMLQKRYNLPPMVVNECVNYFAKFRDFPDSLPVIWHQSLLVLVNNYKHVFTPGNIEAIKALVKVQRHATLSAVIADALASTCTDIQM